MASEILRARWIMLGVLSIHRPRQPQKEESPLDGLTELEGASLRQHFEFFPRSLRSLTNLGARSK